MDLIYIQENLGKAYGNLSTLLQHIENPEWHQLICEALFKIGKVHREVNICIKNQELQREEI